MKIHHSEIYARYLGNDNDYGFRRGRVYKLAFSSVEYSLIEKIVYKFIKNVYINNSNKVSVSRISKNYSGGGLVLYKNMEAFSREWRIESNGYFRNVKNDSN